MNIQTIISACNIPTLMETKDDLNLETPLFGHIQELLITTPIIVLWSFFLHNPPPHFHHNPLHTCTARILALIAFGLLTVPLLGFIESRGSMTYTGITPSPSS